MPDLLQKRKPFFYYPNSVILSSLPLPLFLSLFGLNFSFYFFFVINLILVHSIFSSIFFPFLFLFNFLHFKFFTAIFITFTLSILNFINSLVHEQEVPSQPGLFPFLTRQFHRFKNSVHIGGTSALIYTIFSCFIKLRFSVLFTSLFTSFKIFFYNSGYLIVFDFFNSIFVYNYCLKFSEKKFKPRKIVLFDKIRELENLLEKEITEEIESSQRNQKGLTKKDSSKKNQSKNYSKNCLVKNSIKKIIHDLKRNFTLFNLFSSIVKLIHSIYVHFYKIYTVEPPLLERIAFLKIFEKSQQNGNPGLLQEKNLKTQKERKMLLFIQFFLYKELEHLINLINHLKLSEHKFLTEVHTKNEHIVNRHTLKPTELTLSTTRSIQIGNTSFYKNFSFAVDKWMKSRRTVDGIRVAVHYVSLFIEYGNEQRKENLAKSSESFTKSSEKGENDQRGGNFEKSRDSQQPRTKKDENDQRKENNQKSSDFCTKPGKKGSEDENLKNIAHLSTNSNKESFDSFYTDESSEESVTDDDLQIIYFSDLLENISLEISALEKIYQVEMGGMELRQKIFEISGEKNC